MQPAADTRMFELTLDCFQKMAIYSTEITSESDPSDSPLHQRLLKAYILVEPLVAGEVLEAGCGEGRGVNLLINRSSNFTALDKIEEALVTLRRKYPQGEFIRADFPPFSSMPSNRFDCIVSFQVIEHIEEDEFFLRELYRMLKPGGKAFLSTPNRPLSLSRNPWHIREYTASELNALSSRIFTKVTVQGIAGNEKVMAYHEENRKSVHRITKWDFLDLQHRLPASVLRIPYEILNRLNRKHLKKKQTGLVASITHEDYFLSERADEALDLFVTLEK